jgi:hypothetical protein
MTDLDPLLARIDATLAECDDAERLPLPKLAQTFRVPRELLDATPVRIEDQLNAECATRIDDATRTPPPCCDLHNQHCEVPADLCCDMCPRAVELAELVAEHQQAAERERQARVDALVDALVETTHKHQSRLTNWLLRLRRQ